MVPNSTLVTVTSLIEAEIRGELAAEPDLKERLKIAMTAAKHHWMAALRNDEQLSAAVSAVILSYPREAPEVDLLQREMKALQQTVAALNAMMTGAASPEHIELPQADDDFVGIMLLWRGIE